MLVEVVAPGPCKAQGQKSELRAENLLVVGGPLGPPPTTTKLVLAEEAFTLLPGGPANARVLQPRAPLAAHPSSRRGWLRESGPPTSDAAVEVHHLVAWVLFVDHRHCASKQ